MRVLIVEDERALADFTSLEALASRGLSMPMARNAVDGLHRDMRPNADFLTVTSIVASMLLGNAHSALMILALSGTAELMTSYTIERTRSSIKKMLSADEGEAWKVMPDGKQVRLTPIEYSILLYLAEHRGSVVAVEDLFRAVWNEDFMPGSNNTVMVHIRHLREKIGDDAQKPRFIKNVWGVGYIIE